MPLQRFLLRLYPRQWRNRYGDEFLALLGDQPLPVRTTLDIARTAFREHARSFLDAKSRSSRWGRALQRFVWRLGASSMLAAVGCAMATIIALALRSTLLNPSVGFMIGLPVLELSWFACYFATSHRFDGRRRRRWSESFGALTPTRLTALWIGAIVLMALERWVVWSFGFPDFAREAIGFRIAGSYLHLSNFVLPMCFSALATIAAWRPQDADDAGPPPPPRPLGLA